MKEPSTPTARVTILMRATTAVPSTVLAAAVSATMAEAVRKYSTVRDRKKVLDYGTQNVRCSYGSRAASYLPFSHVLPVSH